MSTYPLKKSQRYLLNMVVTSTHVGIPASQSFSLQLFMTGNPPTCLAGVVILGEEDNAELFPLAFQYWRRALALRLMDTEDCHPIFKEPTKSKNGQLSEWSTLDDLQLIEQDPIQRKIQSLLVRLRISSNLSCWLADVNKYFIRSFYFLSMQLPPHEGWVSQTLNLYWTTLDTILRSECPHESHLISTVLNFESWLIDIFLTLPNGNVNMNSVYLQNLVELILMTDLPYLTDTNMETPAVPFQHLLNVYQMIEILSRHPQLITEEIWLPLYQYVRRDVRDLSGVNLLHTACYFLEQSLSSIRFLLQLEADPNARIADGYGVLHRLAEKPESETRNVAARLLLEHGAHVDMADNSGRTAADYWHEKNYQEMHRLPDWLKEGVPMLKCLCSRVIRRHRLPYEDGALLPDVLIPFVTLH